MFLSMLTSLHRKEEDDIAFTSAFPLKDLESHPIIYFAQADWWTSNQVSGMHLALEFSHHTPVLFINTVSPSIPRNFLSRNFMRRALRKLPSYLKVFRKVRPNLYVYTPITIFTSKPGLAWLNRSFLLLQIRTLKWLVGFKKPIIWVSNAAAAPIVDRIDKRCLVYSLTDKFDKTRYIHSKKPLKAFDKILIQRADIVLCVSRQLERYYRKHIGRRMRYLQHAVDFYHFSRDRQMSLPTPEEIANIPHPIIGYHGSLNDSNHLDWIAYCAKNHPEWSFFLIGNVMHNDVLALGRKYRNVYLPGFVEYKKLPSFVRHFDVCLLFWKMTEWIRYCSPYKTKEYLAMGKPIVSVPIPEIVEEYPQMIATADTAEKFCKAIEHELATDSREKSDARVARVREDTWANYVQKVREILAGFKDS